MQNDQDPASEVVLRIGGAHQHFGTESKLDSRADSLDAEALPPDSVYNSHKTSNPGSTVARPMTRSQSLRKSATCTGENKSALRENGSKQVPENVASAAHQGKDSSANTRHHVSSRIAPGSVSTAQKKNGLERTRSSAASHKRTQSASSQSVGRSTLSSNFHLRSTSNVPKHAAQNLARPSADPLSDIGVKTKTETILADSKLQRPAFSTFQQHFSPKKIVQAPQTSSLSAIADDASASQQQPSVDDVRLQAELLQLHILHKSSLDIPKRWENSAQRSLKLEFQNISRKHKRMLEDETLAKCKYNQMAMKEWTKAQPTIAVEDHIECLSKLLQEILSLTASHGRYTRLCEEFDQWIEIAAKPFENSTSSFSEYLNDNWKDEHTALLHKLMGMSRGADQLPSQSNDSSVAKTTMACKDLIRGMLNELRTMVDVERSIIAKDHYQIDQNLVQLQRDVEILSPDLGSVWGTGSSKADQYCNA